MRASSGHPVIFWERLFLDCRLLAFFAVGCLATGGQPQLGVLCCVVGSVAERRQDLWWCGVVWICGGDGGGGGDVVWFGLV